MPEETIMTRDEIKALNERFMDNISSTDQGLQKQAVDAVNDFTRTKMREEGFYRQLIPMLPITNDELDRDMYETPIKWIDREPDSPAAISVPFAANPMSLTIKGPRYKVSFSRIMTPLFNKDVDLLRTWVMDIRQVLSDNSLKDMLAEEDSAFLLAVNSAMLGQGLTVPTSGTVQWQAISGGITRDTLNDAMKIIPSTPSNLETHTILINNITIYDVCKFGRDEMGGDLSQEIMRQGWTQKEFMGKKWLITIKKNLVPTGSIYLFADPKFIGKSYALEDSTMYIKRERWWIEFCAYESIGGAIGWTSGLGRADFV